jgi:hypothetical protein
MTSKTADLAPDLFREVIHHAAQACSQACTPPLLLTARLNRSYVLRRMRMLAVTWANDG